MNKHIILYIILGFTNASCENRTYPAKFSVLLVDENGSPIRDHLIGVGTFSHHESGQGFGKDIWDKETKKSDAEGLAEFYHLSKTGEFGINPYPAPAGHYMTWIPNYKFKEVVDNQWLPQNPTIEIEFKRIRNPIPMCAINLKNTSGGGLPIPEVDKNLGYDFEIGDWVSPNGKGRSTDIVFHGTFEKQPSGDSKRVITVSFKGREDGLIAFDQELSNGSEFRSDYEAPLVGYMPIVKLVRSIKGDIVEDSAKVERNYYFRVRTKLDENGNLISANYGKIYGDFMSFIYYYNPTPNDRNVEFDPKRNLFRDLPEAQKVNDP